MKSTHLTVFGLIFCSCGVLAQREITNLTSNITLEYGQDTSYVGPARMSFELRLVDISGWFALGFSYDQALYDSMSDWYVVAFNTSFQNNIIGVDSYHPRGSYIFNASNLRKDAVDNLHLISGEQKTGENNETVTYIRFSRYLETGDTDHDLVIHNRTIHLWYAYNPSSDDFANYENVQYDVNMINLLGPVGNGGSMAAASLWASLLIMAFVALVT